MVTNIYRVLRIFVYKHRLDRDPNKWVIELGTAESDALAIVGYERCGNFDEKYDHKFYEDVMTLTYFMEEEVYRRINVFRGITIEWFKPKLAFREKRENG